LRNQLTILKIYKLSIVPETFKLFSNVTYKFYFLAPNGGFK